MMADMRAKDGGKINAQRLLDGSFFKEVVKYFESVNWEISHTDKKTLKEFADRHRKISRQSKSSSYELVSIKVLDVLASNVFEKATGQDLKNEYEKHIKKIKGSEGKGLPGKNSVAWLNETIEKHAVKYGGEFYGKGSVRYSKAIVKESAKFAGALLISTTADALTNPTIGFKELNHLLHHMDSHLLGLGVFSIGAGFGSATSRMISELPVLRKITGNVYGSTIQWTGSKKWTH